MHRNDIVKSKIADPELVEWRRAQIINAAVDLFGRQGYHATKMRDIADKAGVSIGLIYQYVQDKEDVLFLTILEVLNSYLREVPAAVSDETEPLMRFRRAIHAYCMVNHVNADATVLAYRETKSLAPERRDLIKEKELETNKMIEVFVRDCEDAGLFEPVDTELFVYQIVMFSHTWALKAWRFRKLMTVNEYVERGLDKSGIKFIAEGSLTEDDIVDRIGNAALGLITTQHYSAAHNSPENKAFVADFKKANNGMRPNLMAVQSYDGMHLIYEALKKTKGATDGDALVNAMKGMSWISPRGPMTIDPETREVIQNIYIRKVERVDGELYNVEFETIPNYKDPSKLKK